MQQKISFEQIPTVLGAIESKLDYVISRLDATASPLQGQSAESEQLMDLEEACKFLGKKSSTIYSMTSERKIPFMKRGNKLYFLKSDLLEWVKSGRLCNEQYDSNEESRTDFELHLQ
ncbi:MAG: helix-turn-helix domain-containing protein [Bacteroidales bacterium]|nr:helix-turn-helix domain-containing protein [Bacteroidales bacterium]